MKYKLTVAGASSAYTTIEFTFDTLQEAVIAIKDLMNYGASKVVLVKIQEEEKW